MRDYVLESEETTEFLKRLLSMLDFSVPLYLKEGKSELVVGIGCTGGKHRSVTIAMQLNDHFREKAIGVLFSTEILTGKVQRCHFPRM